MKTWKVALAGCGAIAGGVYMPQMARIPNAEMVAVCDILPERAQAYAKQYNVPKWYADVDTMLAECDFDIFMDTASIQAHYTINMAALRAGKHLYSQKPVGLTVEQVTEMIELAAKKKVKFSASPIHMLRPDIQWAKKMISAGTIGKVSMIRCSMAHGGPEYFQFREADPTWFFRPGAGALYDMGVHALHCTTGLLGPAKAVGCMAATSEPERTVRSGAFDGMRIRTDELADNYLISLDFGDATLGVVDTGFCAKAQKTPGIEIYGTKGTICFIGEPGNPLEVYVDVPERRIRGWVKPYPTENLNMDFFQSLCLKDLIEAIEQDRPVGLTPEHARHVVEIMCKIPLAAKERRVMELTTTF
jgi:UDP-N-acetyl-2-amino-2-deoxyglucuronate dehydrogenase